MIHSNGQVVDHVIKLEIVIGLGVYNPVVAVPAIIEGAAKALLEELGYTSVTNVVVRKI